MNNKSVFHSSVIVTKRFGCFWDTFSGVRGPPGTQLGGEMPYCGNMWVYNFVFWCLLVIFHQYPTLAGGLNMASRPQYIAIPPSFDNTRTNLLARIEIPKS